MKQTNYLSLAALALAAAPFFFTACDKDHDYARTYATFTATIHPMETRASNSSWAAEDAIGVSASGPTGKYVNVQYKADAAGKFSVVNPVEGEDNTFYFDDESVVNFSAYYPYTGANGTLPGTGGVISHSIKADDQTVEGQAGIDYLFGTGSGSSASPQVDLNFKHSMCRIILNFKAGEGVSALSDITYTLGGVKMDGTFNVSTGVAEVTQGVNAKDLTIEVSQADEMKSALILFPGQMGASQKYSLQVVMNGMTYECADIQVVPNGEDTKPGYSYSQNVTLDKTRMTVEASTITPWEDVSGGDISVTY